MRNEEAINSTLLFAKNLLRPTLSTVEYSSGYLLFYRIRRFVFELIAHACINTRNSKVSIRNYYVIARKQVRNEDGTSCQSSPKIYYMPITRLICIK